MKTDKIIVIHKGEIFTVTKEPTERLDDLEERMNEIVQQSNDTANEVELLRRKVNKLLDKLEDE